MNLAPVADISKASKDYIYNRTLGRNFIITADYIRKNVENYVLSLQLDYRDNNTLFYFKKVTKLNFAKEWLEIVQSNNSHAFFDYKHILEYCVINAEDVIDLGVV